MNRYQTSKLNSFKLICLEAEQHKESVAQIQKFQTGITRLTEICTEVEQLKVLQKQDTKGIAADKKNTHEDLTELLVDISGALQSYASEKKNDILYEKVNLSENQIELLKQDKLISFARLVVSEAEAISAEDLGKEGISAEDLASYKTLLENYEKLLNSPRETQIERANNTYKLASLIDEGWEIKKETLDKLVSQFKRKDADFYMKYQSASHIIYKRSSKNGVDDEETIVESQETEK